MIEEYDERGRIIGGPPELTIETASADYAALAANGTDALLIAAHHALRRELSRRVREALLDRGLVDETQTVTIADGAEAGRGDLIMCTRNNHRIEAGEPGRTLANGDLLRIDEITNRGLVVRRALDADRETGQRRWTDQQFLYADFADAELGYAVTGHVAQGRTVRVGLAVLTGSEDRQHAYVALTRGTDQNTAYVFTTPANLADLSPSTRPAPELARYDHLSDHAGRPDRVDPDDPGPTSPVSALAEIIAGRDGARQSAAQAWRQALSDADHLAVLHAMWTTETMPAREQRYRALLQAALPPGSERQEPRYKEQWLHRTLRAAELAGLDPGEVLARAVAERDLVGARDVAGVIDARIRRRHDLVPRSAAAWSTQVPETGDPGRSRFLTQLAGVMDDRRRRIGEHAAASSLPWAVAALGSVPDEAAARLAWQERAAAIGTYRELSGHDHPGNPIGPEPAANTPDLRAAWHAARVALASGHARDSGAAARYAHAEAGAAHSHGEHAGAVRQVGQRQGYGQESRLPDLAETSSRIEELAVRRRELIAGMAERHGMHVPAKDCGLRLGTSLAFPLEHAHHRAAILQHPSPRSSRHPGSRNGSQTGT